MPALIFSFLEKKKFSSLSASSNGREFLASLTTYYFPQRPQNALSSLLGPSKSNCLAKKSSRQFRQNIFQLEIRQKKCLFLHDLHLFTYSVELLFKLIIQLNHDVIDEDATLLRQELLATWIRELTARQVTISPTMTSTIWRNMSPHSLSLFLGRFSFVF